MKITLKSYKIPTNRIISYKKKQFYINILQEILHFPYVLWYNSFGLTKIKKKFIFEG